MIGRLHGAAVTRCSAFFNLSFRWDMQYVCSKKSNPSVNFPYVRDSVLRCFSTSLAEKEAVEPRHPATIRNTAIIAHVDVRNFILLFTSRCMFWSLC